MKNLYRAIVITAYGILITAFSPENSTAKNDDDRYDPAQAVVVPTTLIQDHP
jgi:hypothetical protein